MKRYFLAIFILALLKTTHAQESGSHSGYLSITSEINMIVTINDSLEVYTPTEPILLPDGEYRLKANALNDRNWYSKTIKADFTITAGETTQVRLEAERYRLIQSDPGQAFLVTQQDSTLGKTPYILDYNDAFSILYLEKKGYLRKRIDITDQQWPMMVTLQREEELRQAISIPAQMKRPSPFRKYLKPGLAVTAVASNWLSFYLKRKADDYYDKYHSSSDLNRMNRYYDRTEQFDLYSAVMLGVSTAATVTFFYLLLSD
jgi:hypothetical protein